MKTAKLPFMRRISSGRFKPWYLGRTLALVCVVLIICLALDLSGAFTLDPNERFVERRYKIYKVKRFLFMTQKNAPLVHRTVGLFLGNTWNRSYCGAAYRERQTYEKRMEKHRFDLQCRSAQSATFTSLWAKLDLGSYSRFFIKNKGMRVDFVILAKDLPAVETFIAEYDQPEDAIE